MRVQLTNVELSAFGQLGGIGLLKKKSAADNSGPRRS
jgi:hypothetical protein